MKTSILMALWSATLFAQSEATVTLEREISHVLLTVPEHSIFDSIQFQLGANNKVTLEGQVTSEEVKAAAARDVNAIPGVGLVVNRLKVQPLTEGESRTREKVLEAIRAEPSLKGYARSAVWPVHILVDQGVVTLEGTVASETAKTQAGVAANSVPAVSQVINHLRVAAGQSGAAQSSSIHNVATGEEE